MARGVRRTPYKNSLRTPRFRGTSDAALGGPFLAKSRYHIARGHRKTACSPVWDLFVRLQKPLLNDDYAARRSICAFSAVEGMWAVRAYRVVLRRFDECDSQRRLFDPTEPLLLRGRAVATGMETVTVARERKGVH